MLRRAAYLLLLLPGLASGQTLGSVSALVTTQGISNQANRAECASATSTATWAIVNANSFVSGNGDKWRLAANAASSGCSTTTLPTGIQDVTATGASQSITGVLVSSMKSAASADCASATDTEVILCVYRLIGGSTSSWALAATSATNFIFQTAIPPAPIISGSLPGDAQLSIAVGPGVKTQTEQAEKSITYTVSCAVPGGSTSTGGPSNAGNVICAGLTNGLSYSVTAMAYSAANNPSATSLTWGPDASTTPLPFQGFWETYKGYGGVETGGCGNAGAGVLAPVLAALALLAVTRRRS